VENEALAMDRYGALSCEACKTFYSAQSPSVCSECHPQYIEDCRKQMGDYDEEDYYERMERRYAPIY
jgi:ribosomal protein L31